MDSFWVLRTKGLGILLGWVAPRLGVSNYELAIFLLVLISLGVQIIIARGTVRMVTTELSFLDQRLAQAIQSVVEELPSSLQGSVENSTTPFQAMLMDIIKERMKIPAIQAKEIETGPRDLAGKFSNLEKDTI